MIYGLLGYFVLIALLLLFKDRARPRKVFRLFRAFFPSWKFFEDLGELPELCYRVKARDEWSDWHACLPRVERRWNDLFFNPSANFRLAGETLLQQLMAEIADMEDGDLSGIEGSVTYRLIHHLVRTRLRDASGEYQFKMRSEMEDFLVSPVYSR